MSYENYRTIANVTEVEIEIKKSKFISFLIPISSEDDVIEQLKLIRKSHHRANHHCSAYIIGENDEIQRMSDDGEPTGTAGIPMLEVLKHHKLTNVLAVVVRYFGGIKLGAGGLIRAYGTAVSESIKEAKLVANITQMLVSLTVGYHQVDILNYYFENTVESITIIDVQYSEQVMYKIAINHEKNQIIKEAIISLLSGQASWTELGEETVFIPVK